MPPLRQAGDGRGPGPLAPAAGVGAFSAAVLRFTNSAISANTARTYAKPVARYQAFCEARGWDASPGAVTAVTLAEFVAALGAEGRLKTRSIGVYRSAISTWRVLNTLSDGPNPATSVAVDRVIRGIARERQPVEAEARAARLSSFDVTPALLAALQPFLAPSFPARTRPHELVRWAAANVATYALLRPSELLGSPQHPERALLESQITFYMTKGSDHVGALCPRGVDPCSVQTPDHFTIALGPSKADQQGLNPPIPVAARPAVLALWVWMHARRDLSTTLPLAPQLFRVPGFAALRLPELTDAIADACEASGRPRPHVAGRAFRRGGASDLMAAGAAGPVMQAAGRWRSYAMPELYSSMESKIERAMEASRSMEPRS